MDLVNQVAEETARRMTGGVNVVTGKAFTPTLNDYTVLIVTAVTGAVERGLATIPGATAIDVEAIANEVAATLAERLAK